MKLDKGICIAVFAASFVIPAFAENPLISGAFSAVMKVHLEHIIQEIEENLLSH